MASLLSIFPLGTLLQSESGDEVRASCRILEKCSESAFQSLVTAATDAVRSSTSAVALAGHPALSSFPSTTALECSRALLALVVDFARCNVSGASVTGAIEECGLSPSKAASFSSIYSSVLSGLRESLGSAGKAPQLVDITWRLDFLVSSKELGRVARPVYRVCFILEETLLDGTWGRRKIDVACSPQELESLQSALKSAVQAADKLVAGLGDR